MYAFDWGRWLGRLFAAVAVLATLWLATALYAAGEAVWAVACLGLCGLGVYIYTSSSVLAMRYLFPGVAGMMIFVVFPLLYTIQIGFTNYSSTNLLSFERATSYLLERTVAAEGAGYRFELHPDGAEFRLVLTPANTDEDEADGPDRRLISARLALLQAAPPEEVVMSPYAAGSFQAAEPLALGEVLKHRGILSRLTLMLPDGTRLSYAGVREFSPLQPVWKKNAGGHLERLRDAVVFRPNMDTGFYESADGEKVEPGFKVGVGFENYFQIFTDPEFRGPFLAIFVWTVVFASLTVLLTGAVGISLAVLLNWESLRFRAAYRTLLFLPYAVPGFISILVFKGLFNQNFGEINAILDYFFGVRPAWFADPLLAKVMILIVNTWLGYPYVMILCTGLIKAIPADLYEASSIAGAGPLTNFFKITAPLIVKPLAPLLIGSFAFNFNNFVLIALLTNGRPDFLNTKVPAGTTDILVSYTYRIAFQDSGQNFGLAAAISTVIFFMVALISLVNLRLMKNNQEKG